MNSSKIKEMRELIEKQKANFKQDDALLDILERLLEDFFLLGRTQALDEVKEHCKLAWANRYNRVSETLTYETETEAEQQAELEKELGSDADTLTIRQVVDCQHGAYKSVESYIDILLRKLTVQQAEK